MCMYCTLRSTSIHGYGPVQAPYEIRKRGLFFFPFLLARLEFALQLFFSIVIFNFPLPLLLVYPHPHSLTVSFFSLPCPSLIGLTFLPLSSFLRLRGSSSLISSALRLRTLARLPSSLLFAHRGHLPTKWLRTKRPTIIRSRWTKSTRGIRISRRRLPSREVPRPANLPTIPPCPFWLIAARPF